MYELLSSLFFSIVFCFLAYFLHKVENDKPELKEGKAIITHLSDHDRRVRYYVTLDVEGEVIKGESIRYSPSKKNYNIGDVVPISYYLTNQGWARVFIQDEELNTGIPLSVVSKFFLLISLVFFVLMIYHAVNLIQ